VNTTLAAQTLGHDKTATVSEAGEETEVAAPEPGQRAPADSVAETPNVASEMAGETSSAGRGRERQRALHGNALGTLIERQFAMPSSPVRSYSDLERRSGISREALSRYVTARADRRRSPTIDTLVAIADAMHLSLDAVCRAAAASVKGHLLPSESVQQAREQVLSPLVSGLSDDQFSAVFELLRYMRPPGS
jgi:transcriptional regulator with XRE-family HTH domain